MNFKTKLLAAAVLPVMLIAIASYWVINQQSNSLAETQIATLEQRTLNARRAELEKMNQLALNAIRQLYENPNIPIAEAQSRAKRLLHEMAFGEDGYFFVYSLDGTNIVHPRLPNLVGKNWWDLQDPDGDFVIRNLVKVAQSGGGFHSYVWNKPSTGKLAPKIGHAVLVEPWGWMIGTGLYTDDVEAEVATLRAELEQSIDSTKTKLLSLTLLAVLLAALFTYLIRLSEQRFADRRLKELTNRIVEVQEDERKRVSTELHDGISQLLVSARYGLDNAMTHVGPGANKALTKSMGIIDDAIGEVRRISMALRPSVLDDIGLAAAIKSLGNDFAEQSNIKVFIDTTPVGDRISGTARTALYRVAQEALTNVAKHSNAGQVWIRLEARSQDVCLTTEDDGSLKIQNSKTENSLNGSDSVKFHRNQDLGMGLRNMQERMDAFQGALSVTPSTRGGLRICAILPVTGTARNNMKNAELTSPSKPLENHVS